MPIRLFVKEDDGEEFEITDLYWFEENFVHWFDETGGRGEKYEFRFVFDGDVDAEETC